MTLWSSADAEQATLGKASARFAVGGLSIDTRTLKEGDLFRGAERRSSRRP